MIDAYYEQLKIAYLREYCERQVWRSVQWNGVEFWNIPQDIVAMAEAIHQSKCDAVVEVGVNAGGGLEFYSTILSLNPKGLVVGIDVDVDRSRFVAAHNPDRIKLVHGNSANPKTVETVRAMTADRRILVVLDSDHSAAHVAKELELYAPLVSPGSYLIVMDGIIKDLVGVSFIPLDAATNNPETAVAEFLPRHPEFGRDFTKNRFGITWAPGGFLRKKS